jgi:AbiV family abortive infection protein
MLRPIPPRDDLLALFQAAKTNAGDLISDAELLADVGRFPRAHALATLAHDEIGKAQLFCRTRHPNVRQRAVRG